MFELAKKTKAYWMGAVLGLLAGALLYAVQPVRWEGQALVRIGHILQFLPSTNTPVTLIESPLTVVERFKSPSFAQAVAKRVKNKESAALLNVNEGADLTVKSIRTTDTLVISAGGGSSELVRATIDSAVEELVIRHKEILNAYLADTQHELSRIATEMDDLSKRIARGSKRNGVGEGLAVMIMQQELNNRMNRSSELREEISGKNVQPTELLEPISVSEQRIFSSLWRSCLFGALFGLFLSAIVVRWRR